MNIVEAIERLTRMEQTLGDKYQKADKQALQFGVEALKRIKNYRVGAVTDVSRPLAGEEPK